MDVVAALAKDGVKVAASQVSSVNLAMRGKPKSGKTAGRPAESHKASLSPVEAIRLASQPIHAAGTDENTIEIIEVLNGNMVDN